MPPFRIFKLRTDGSLHFVEEAPTLKDARERIRRTSRVMARFKMRKQASECALPQGAKRRITIGGEATLY
jgi:hypothetical protein